MKSKLTTISLGLIALMLMGCTTLPVDKSNDFTLKGAENSVFVYGAFVDKTGLLPNHLDVMTFYQIDPDKQNQILNVKTSSLSYYWVAKDVMPGGSFKLVYYSETSGRVIYYGTPGLQGQNLMDFKTPDKPGIYFAGRVEVTKEGLVIDRSKTEELRILKNIPVSTGTGDWSPLLKARIQELENE